MRVYVGSRQIAQYPNNQSRLFRAAMTDLLKAVSVHPTAKLINRLQLASEIRDWEDSFLRLDVRLKLLLLYTASRLQ